MDRLIFEEKEGKKNKTTAVRVSKEIHESLIEISRKTELSVYTVADRLLAFALDNVEWKKSSQ